MSKGMTKIVTNDERIWIEIVVAYFKVLSQSTLEEIKKELEIISG
jgi:hypothetical protein